VSRAFGNELKFFKINMEKAEIENEKSDKIFQFIEKKNIDVIFGSNS
jgi:hypothetical protein